MDAAPGSPGGAATGRQGGSLGHRLFRADDSAARNFFVITALWLVFGTAMGLLLAIEFVFPDFMSWLPFVFSRLRQEHTNTVMFGFLSTGMIGLWYYILPRLTGRRLWSEPLANLVLALWTGGVLIGVLLISMAHSQSREYAEMVWGVDIAVLAALLINLVIVFMTIARRVESKLYVTLWFIIGTAMWMPLLYAIGNVVWNPPTGALTGINDAIWNWFYGHNVLGLWFTTGMLGVFYYLLPKETHTPLYSVKLGLMSFWGTLLFYTGVGGHHLLWAPIPGWLKVTAVAESIGMILPVTAFFINAVMTMRGNWSRFFSNVSLRFTMLGAIAYIIVSFQGTQTALFGMNSLAHFTQYVPGHSHLGLLFFSGSIVIGGIYYALPRILNCELYGRRLASVQWVLYVVGFSFFFIGFTVAGLVQGSNWVMQGLPVWEVLPGIRVYMALRIFGGGLMFASFLMVPVIVIGTLAKRVPNTEPHYSFGRQRTAGPDTGKPPLSVKTPEVGPS